MEKINQILADTFKISIDKAEVNANMDDITSWDSLTHMGLIVALEDEFGIEMNGDDIADMITFDAIRLTVAKYINK